MSNSVVGLDVAIIRSVAVATEAAGLSTAAGHSQGSMGNLLIEPQALWAATRGRVHQVPLWLSGVDGSDAKPA
jgi:hypothetical protein